MNPQVHNKQNRSKRAGEQNGFIEIILLTIIALVGLKYFFNFSIFEFLGTEEGMSLLDYLKDLLVWLKDLLIKLWHYIQ